MRGRLQQFGSFLAGMVVPNIAAFIAWGLLAALFIPAGWLPNPHLAKLVSPSILTLLPLLIGFTGGRLVYGIRGGVVGAVATMGLVVGSNIPMFLGAMIVGPAAGWTIRAIDRVLQPRIPAGFEMLAANFSAGLTGLALMLANYIAVEPAVTSLTGMLAAGARVITNAGLLPLLALIIEPAKVLFVNNAINHGILSPLGIVEAKETGKSVLFLLESNPGPGFGLLAAYALFGKGTAKSSAPGALVIQFFGGIHELYFPFVLMNPATLLAVVAGGVAAAMTFVATGAGLVATPSPGSIFAEIAMSPRGGLLPVLLGIGISAIVSFVVATPLVRRAEAGELPALKRSPKPETIVFVCEAGMGSSVMGQSILQRKLKEAGLEIKVEHAALSELQPSAGIIVANRGLEPRIRELAPDARIYAVDQFIRTPVYDQIIEELACAFRSNQATSC